MKTNIANDIMSYLTFLVGNKVFGVPVSKVQNIVEMSRVSKIHHTSSNVWGFIAQRGIAIPVLDKRNLLGGQFNQYTDNTCVVVLELDADKNICPVGIIIDALQEVAEVRSIDINYLEEGNVVTGIQPRDGRQDLVILNAESLFTNEEMDILKNYIPE